MEANRGNKNVTSALYEMYCKYDILILYERNVLQLLISINKIINKNLKRILYSDGQNRENGLLAIHHNKK